MGRIFILFGLYFQCQIKDSFALFSDFRSNANLLVHYHINDENPTEHDNFIYRQLATIKLSVALPLNHISISRCLVSFYGKIALKRRVLLQYIIPLSVYHFPDIPCNFSLKNFTHYSN